MELDTPMVTPNPPDSAQCLYRFALRIGVMVGSESASKRHQFTTRVDLLVALDSVGIDHLEVSQERAIVIFNCAILTIEVESGQ